MKKKHYALIGHPIAHSMSSFIHKRLFELSNTQADYDLINIPAEDLGMALNSLKELDGFNVTIPHKQTIIPYLDSLSKKAKLYKSINVIKNTNGRSKGYTTDPDGFIAALELANIPLNGKVVILGAGGASRAAAYEAVLAGCETVIAVRPQSLNHAASLIGDIKTTTIAPQISSCTLEALKGRIDLLVNATPVGTYPKIYESPIFADIVENCTAVFDMVYNPYETMLIKLAKSNGIKYSSGLSMLVWQAVYAHNIWTGAQFSCDDINQLCIDTNAEMNKIFPVTSH